MTSSVQAMTGIIGPPFMPTLSNRNCAASVVFGATATAMLLFFGDTSPDSFDGKLILRTNAGDTDCFPEWGYGRGAVPAEGVPFYIMLTPLGPVAPTGGDVTGVKLQLSGVSGRTWSLSRTAVGTSSGDWRVDIFYGASGALVATATYSMSAAVIPP